ncbi:aldo/keto reductase [Streptomyces pinistramenti]|uniref:aldo/keto reductase n=1 Tax=Streptomyces pinistramenti TaxID=2884812 RepID=UPI001D087D81|nr:aldo/keto reductase [Streptomyces pinistramenti]MCB5908335.1 aldo/keto reductase [Streptomyces pinistramenti]
MKRRILGGTGISVSEYALGAMMLGALGTTDHDEAVRIVHRALDAGINFVDTADVYASGESEEIVGKALKGRRDEVVLATKFRSSMGPDANHGGGSRRWIVRAVEDSLRRLGTDHLDLYQMHRPDPATDVDETLAALSDLVRSGKVRAIGSSTFPAEQIVEAQWTAERRGHVRFRTEQPPYSILARQAEAAVLPTAQRYGMGVLTWGPLSAGWLSGRALSASSRAGIETQKFDLALPENARKAEAVGALSEVAADAGLTLPHLATAFVRAHPAVTSVIIGPRTMDQLDSLLDGADVMLGADVLDRIDAIVPPGTDLNRADSYYLPPALTDPSLRRR